MLKEENEFLEKICHYLEAEKTEEAFSLLRKLKETASEELQERDMWQVHELFGACFHDIGDAEGAAQAYLRAAQCDRFLRSQRQHFSGYLFALHYLPGIPDEEMAQQHLAYGRLYRDVEPSPLEKKGRFGEKIRLGYLAPFFSEQAAARFYEILLTAYDRERFEVFCYSLEESTGDFAMRMKEQVSEWRDLSGMGVEEAASAIRQDGLDILFDLGGHSEGGMTLMVMAYHPARVQLSGIGWPDTTGLPAMDYLLADEVLAPSDCCDAFFCEKLLRLPHAFCWQPTEEMGHIFRKPRKKGSPVRLGCFNNFMKVTGEAFRLWRDILEQLPEAVLVLQDVFRHPARQREMARRIQAAGLSGRVELHPASPDYLHPLAGIDMVLDTFPYNGGGMTAAALYMGAPVVTLAGSRYGARFGASLLQSAGLPELIAGTEEEYVKKIVALARDEERLGCYQQNLRRKMESGALMDGERYMAELEREYFRLAQ